MTLVQRCKWSGTPLKAGLSPAATHLRALPPAAGPLSTGTCWQVDCWNGFFFLLTTVVLETLRFLFGYLGHQLVILGSRGTPNGHTEAQMSIFWGILGWIWGASKDPLWVQDRDFLWFGMAKRETVSSMFFVIQGWKWCQNALAACAMPIVKTMCFEWCHFFYVFNDLASWGKDLAHILVSFGDPGDTFTEFLGSWRQAWDVMIFQRYPEGARVEVLHPGEGNGMIRGVQ